MIPLSNKVKQWENHWGSYTFNILTHTVHPIGLIPAPDSNYEGGIFRKKLVHQNNSGKLYLDCLRNI